MTESFVPEAGLRWRSERGARMPQRLVPADDTMSADTAFRLACEGTGLVWQGDFQNARALLLAMSRRLSRSIDKRQARRASAAHGEGVGPALFHRHRQLQAHRARVLGMLLIPLDADCRIPLRRAPDVRDACRAAWDDAAEAACPSLVSLRELQGLIGAWEWRRNGVPVAALGPGPANRIHPHYGVFAPMRAEYLELVSQAPLPAGDAARLALDVGTGTGVLAAILARRGLARIIATDNDPRALACAKDNLRQLGLLDRVQLLAADLFPPPSPSSDQARLVVCNPPWLPARPSAPIERAIFDEAGRMLAAFIAGVGGQLAHDGQAWLILSDLAEHLGLRSREQLLKSFDAGGLSVLGRLDAKPGHRRASDRGDLLEAARARETVSLWRLGRR